MNAEAAAIVTAKHVASSAGRNVGIYYTNNDGGKSCCTRRRAARAASSRHARTHAPPAASRAAWGGRSMPTGNKKWTQKSPPPTYLYDKASPPRCHLQRPSARPRSRALRSFTASGAREGVLARRHPFGVRAPARAALSRGRCAAVTALGAHILEVPTRRTALVLQKAPHLGATRLCNKPPATALCERCAASALTARLARACWSTT